MFYLEFLSNELFLELFEYLSSIDLVQSFFNINHRFNNLIYIHLQTHYLDFQSCTKTQFDFLCQQILPSITNHVVSLRLSDDDNTPEQIARFFSYNLSFSHFTHLKSLSIHQIYSFDSLQSIINQLPQLIHLTYLNLTRYYIIFNEIYDIHIIDRIRTLSKLTHCNLDITQDSDCCFCTPSIQTASIQYLSIPYLECTVQQLIQFLHHLRHLYFLNAHVYDRSNDFESISTRKYFSIKILHLQFDGSFESLKILLQTFPNLSKLRIVIKSGFFNGYQWQNLIETYLSNLIILQFKMSCSFPYEHQLNEILESFSSSFWIEQHQWFVQCYWSQSNIFPLIHIYTLPYIFEDFTYLETNQTNSTTTKFYSFDHVKNLYSTSISFTNSSITDRNLSKIRYLYLTSHLDDLLNSFQIQFTRLEILKLVFFDQIADQTLRNLQDFLSQLPRLHTLIYSTWSKDNRFPSSLIHPSIRQLDLRGSMIFYTSQDCQNLIQSSIGQQCQILFINIQEQIDIIHLLNHLEHLRVLIVKCYSLTNWLEQNLPTTCTISNSNQEIRIWIR